VTGRSSREGRRNAAGAVRTAERAPLTLGRGLRLAAAIAVAVGAVLALPGRADAHAELQSTEPAAGSRLDAPPTAVVLRFSEGVDLTDDAIELLDAGGERIAVGEAEHLDGDRSAVTAAVPDLDDGAYVVAWRVVSSDSHPIGGAFTFRVGDAGAAGAVDDQTLVEEVLGGSRDGDRVLGAVYGAVRFVGFAGVTLLAGASVVLGWLWPAGRDDRRARRVVGGAWWAAVVATALSIPLQGAYAAGGTLGDAFTGSFVADELGTRSGRAWVARLVLLVAAAVAAPALRRASASVVRAATVAGGLALVVTVSLTGHAVSGDVVAVGFVADVVHLSGVSVWLGGLALVLFALLWRRGSDADAAHDGGLADAAAVVARFSPVAFGAVVAIVASGTVQGVRQVGGYDALLETTYGRLLLVKVALVVAMLAAAAFSRAWVRQRAGAAGRAPAPVLSPGPGAKAAGELTSDPSTGGVPAGPPLAVLRRSVGTEVALAVAVLVVTALLVNAVPGERAAGAGGTAGGPFDTQLTEDDIVLTLDVDPAEVGPVSIHLYLNEPGGAPVEAEEVTATLALPERDLGPIDVPLVAFGQGHWSADGAEIPLPGDWELEVVARTTDIDQTVFETVVPVP
jgi:copper transport protein